MIRFVVPAGHEFGMREYLEYWGRNVADRFHILYLEALAEKAVVSRGAYLFAGLDRLDEGQMELAVAVANEIADAGWAVYNHPARVLTRLPLLEELHARGLNDFAVRRAGDSFAGLRFPVFLRQEAAHNGAVSDLLQTPQALRAALGRAVLRGYPVSDLLVMEFLDTQDQEGFYRKYAAFNVGGTIVPRSLAHGRAWMLKHRASDFTRKMMEEERAYVLGNPHAESLRDIFRVAGVDYGRIDYAVLDGRVQTWEINLNPTIGRGLRPSSGSIPEALQPLRIEARDRFYSAFESALAALDPGGPTSVLKLTVDRAIRERAAGPGQRTARASRQQGAAASLRRRLQPIKSLLEPAASAASPLIGRIARSLSRPRQ